jgi:hypothetical protein
VGKVLDSVLILKSKIILPKNRICWNCRRELTIKGRIRKRRKNQKRKRNFGDSAAHLVDPVPLLPSGPGGVRGTSLHRARSSTVSQLFAILNCTTIIAHELSHIRIAVIKFSG